jgi:hypothetical protein
MVSHFVKLITNDARRALLETMSLSALRHPQAAMQHDPEEKLHLGRNRRAPNFLGASHGSPSREVCPIGGANRIFAVRGPPPDKTIRLHGS